ncbi:hypothetical protein LJR038_000659 [Acidovorax sp. LjRoot38]|uniref:hypothetical protein n=1 Tax=Acidovorax sp. LjRoot38 TaxID=3342327 RepID=UPI003ECCBB79
MMSLLKKYLLTGTVVTVAAAFVIFGWQVYLERTSKSLSGRVISQSPLQPDSTSTLPGLKVTVDGIPLEKPYLTVIEIRNSGTRHIQASDFEADIELRINSEARVVRAQVATIQPEDLDLKISGEQKSIKIKPLLLNPGDSFSLSILSAGDKPVFTPRARIAGVGKLELDEVSTKKQVSGSQFLAAVFAVVMLVIGNLTAPSFIQSGSLQLTRKTALFISLTSSVIAVFTIGPVFEAIGLQGFRQSFAIIIFSMSVPTLSILWTLLKGNEAISNKA